jgi:hypothetical protein
MTKTVLFVCPHALDQAVVDVAAVASQPTRLLRAGEPASEITALPGTGEPT